MLKWLEPSPTTHDMPKWQGIYAFLKDFHDGQSVARMFELHSQPLAYRRSSSKQHNLR